MLNGFADGDVVGGLEVGEGWGCDDSCLYFEAAGLVGCVGGGLDGVSACGQALEDLGVGVGGPVDVVVSVEVSAAGVVAGQEIQVGVVL